MLKLEQLQLCRLMKLFALVLFPFLINSCANNSNRLTPVSAQCVGNAFLQKYGCSVDRIQQAAQNGDPDAQYALGYMYYYGIDTVQNTQTAILWIKKAANQGQPLATRALNLMSQGRHLNEMHPMNYHQPTTSNHHIYRATPNSYQSKKPSRTYSKKNYQKKSSVSKMNTSSPTEPLRKHLPAYRANRPIRKPAVIKSLRRKRESNQQDVQNKVKAKTSVSTWKQIKVPSRLTKQMKAHVASQIAGKTATENELLKVKPSFYTLQLMGSHNLIAIKDFMRRYNLQKKARYYSANFHGKKWYMLVYGTFSNAVDAHAAAHDLPISIRSLHPWVKSFRMIQEEIHSRKVVS